MFGIEEKKSPVLYSNACGDFIFTENLGAEQVSNTDTSKADNAISSNGAEELIPVLLKALELYQNDDGWVNVGPAGSFLIRTKPDFDPRTYEPEVKLISEVPRFSSGQATSSASD